MRPYRTCPSASTSTVWSPDSRSNPATTEPKTTKRRLGRWRVVGRHSRWRKTRPKAGRPAVFCSWGRGEGGWEYSATTGSRQGVPCNDSVLIWLLRDSSPGWLVLLCTGCWGKRYIPSRLEKWILSYRGWGGRNISRRGLPDIWWTFKQRAVQSNNTSVGIEYIHMTSRRSCWRSKQRNGGQLGGVKYSFED